jgi:hypothetical protein
VRGGGVESQGAGSQSITNPISEQNGNATIKHEHGQTDKIDTGHYNTSGTQAAQDNNGVSRKNLAVSLHEIDPALADLVNAWPNLAPHIKTAVLALVDAGKGATP